MEQKKNSPVLMILIFILVGILLLICCVGSVGYGLYAYNEGKKEIIVDDYDFSEITVDDGEDIEPIDWGTDSLTMELAFGDKIIELSRMGSGNIEYSFWDMPITKIDKVYDPIWGIYQDYPVDSFLYDEANNSYYLLNPGGHAEIRLITKAELDTEYTEKETRTVDEQSDTIMKEVQRPYELAYNSESFPWSAVINESYYIINGTDETNEDNWTMEGYTVVCYIPVEGTDSYLKFDAPVTNIGSEVNMCDSLSYMGIQGAKIK